MSNKKFVSVVKTLDGKEVEVLASVSIKPEEDVVLASGVELTGDSDGSLYYLVHPDTEEEPIWVNHSKFTNTEGTEEVDDEFLDQDYTSPHLQELGYSMVGWLDGLESRPDNDKLPEIVTLLMAIQYDKEGGYGSSWKGKGEYRGIMANIDRKYDRLDKMTMDEIEGKINNLSQLEEDSDQWTSTEDVGESKIDAIADLANYCLLYMTYVKEKYPNVFNVWVSRNIPSYLSDKITFIQK